MLNSKNLKKERYILKFLVGINLIFVLLELGMSIITGSQAILMDAIFDGSELIMSIIALKVLPLMYKPTTEKRPFGYLQIETLLIIIKGFMMSVVTIGVITNGIRLMLSGGNTINHGIVSVFEVFSTLLLMLTILVLDRLNCKLNSPMITTEIKGLKLDTVVSLGLGFAFMIPVFFKGEFISYITPYLDQIISVILALFMLPVPLRTIKLALRDMFLFAPEEEIVDYIKSVSEPILDDNHIESVMYDILKTGRKVWVSIYFVPKQNYISIENMKKLQMEIKSELDNKIPDVYIELIPDIN